MRPFQRGKNCQLTYDGDAGGLRVDNGDCQCQLGLRRRRALLCLRLPTLHLMLAGSCKLVKMKIRCRSGLSCRQSQARVRVVLLTCSIKI